jgi:ABC-2 type transport system permease protein
MSTEATSLRSVADDAPAKDTRQLLTTLVRRELWEHPALWRVPLGVAALLGVSTIFSPSINLHGSDLPHFGAHERVMALNVSQYAWALLIYLAAALVASFFVLDSLYAERKDRSILFWKSLPVSDGLTVLSKFLVAAVIVPLGAFLLAILSHLLALTIWKLRVATGGVPDLVTLNLVAWVRGEFVIFLILLLSSLWYAPVVAASLLVSAWAKRSPLMWATLPLIFIPMLEFIVFRTGFVWSFIRYRSEGIWFVLTHRDGVSVLSERVALLSDLNWTAAFTNVNLWLGVIATAALLYAAARIRRYRDDT